MCLSGRNYSVFATSLEGNYSFLCDRIGPIIVPVRNSLYNDEVYSSSDFEG